MDSTNVPDQTEIRAGGSLFVLRGRSLTKMVCSSFCQHFIGRRIAVVRAVVPSQAPAGNEQSLR